MKKNTKLNLMVLIIGVVIVLLVTSILVPFAIKGFNNHHDKTPVVSCEFVNLNNLKETTVTNSNTQAVTNMYISNSSINGTEPLQIGVSIKNNSNVKTFLRVKITIKLSNTNTNITSENLSYITSVFKTEIDSTKWILASNTNVLGEENTSCNALSGVYLYYKGVLQESSKQIEVLQNIMQTSDNYSGYFPVFDMTCEIAPANEEGALNWVSKAFTALSGWEKAWHESIKSDI